MASKILVTGPINGHVQKAFQKITKLCSKQAFTVVLIIGDVFAKEIDEQAQELLDGKVQIPVPTYFTTGDRALPEAVQQQLEATGEVCPNLFYLGRKGNLKTAEGIKIVFLGGCEVVQEQALTQSIGKYDALFLGDEARALHGAHDAHILLTNQWPTRIQHGSKVELSEGNEKPSTSIMNLCATLKPRYHFSRGQEFGWRREPFCWPLNYSENTTEQSVTRFESLSPVTGKDWISAFVLDPTKPPSTDGAHRETPLTLVSTTRKSNLRKREHDDEAGHKRHRGNGRHGDKRSRFNNSNECFMCLGKPEFDASMVVSIAEESFCTSLKGPLPEHDTFPQLQSSGNLMIIPLYHAADENAHGQRSLQERQAEFAEMTKYRHALQHMLMSKASGQLGAVCWEANRTGIRHFHWQWIPCPQEMVDKGLVEAAFKIAAEKNQYEPFRACAADELIPDRPSDYFRVWIWSTGTSKDSGQSNDGRENGPSSSKAAPVMSPIAAADALAADESEKWRTPPNTSEISMYFELPADQRFNIQFGRTVVSGLLQLEDRTDWRSVPASLGDEARDAEAFKEDFKAWDFAMM